MLHDDQVLGWKAVERNAIVKGIGRRVAGVEVDKRWAEHCFYFFIAVQLPNPYSFLVASRPLANRPSGSSNDGGNRACRLGGPSVMKRR